jgi:hypothetical protein
MTTRHAMLVIARAVFDMVQIPGQEPLLVAQGAGDEAARQWWHDNEQVIAAQVFRQNNASWQRRLANWNAHTDIEFGKERLHEGGPRVDVARIRFPDGTESVAPPEAAKDYVAEEFRALNPPPTVAAQFADWRDTVQIAETPTWIGRFFNGDQDLPLDMGLPTSQFGFPIREVLSCLDRLAADGWQVVHVSEDRGLHHPEGDPAHESAVSTVRYLLSRTDDLRAGP